MVKRIVSATPPPSGRKPELNIAPHQVAGLLDELKAYHRLFADLFQRREQRQWSQKYMEGQLLDLERKAIEPNVPCRAASAPHGMRALVGGHVKPCNNLSVWVVV